MTKQDSHLRKLFGQSSHYLIATVLVSISGLVSFPIFTRIFTVSDYGVLNLVTCTISTLVAVSKFGLNNAAVRFFQEYKSEKRNQSLSVYYSTLFFGSILITGLICLLFAHSIYYLKRLFPEEVSNLLLISSIIIFLDTPGTVIINFLRANQKTKFISCLSVITTYSGLLLSIFLVFYWIRGLYGFYTGKILTCGITLLFLAIVVFRGHTISFRLFSIKFLKESVKYGIPLMGFEFCNHILAYLDRYLIQCLMGSKPLGIYSAGYNLCSQITNVACIPLSLVMTPLLIDIWVNEGKEATQEFLNKALTYFLVVLFPIGFGFVAVSPDLITFLASDKYRDASIIVPYVIGGTMIFSLYHIFNAGLIIHKKTSIILYFVAAAAFTNLILNYFWIPKFGILGAAYATFVSYVGFTICIALCSFRFLSFPIPYAKALTYAIVSAVMFSIVKIDFFDTLAFNLIGKITVGVLFYASAVLAADRGLRLKCFAFIKLH